MKYYSYQGDPLHLPQVYEAPVLMTWRLLWDLFQFKLLSPRRNCAHIQIYLLERPR